MLGHDEGYSIKIRIVTKRQHKLPLVLQNSFIGYIDMYYRLGSPVI